MFPCSFRNGAHDYPIPWACVGPLEMKFWQLVSAFRSEASVLKLVFASHDWGQFGDWYTRFESIVAAQDRLVLDEPVPDALVHAVASLSAQEFQLTPDGTLRIASDDCDGEVLSAVDVLERFGGAVIEEVHEFGSVRVR